jgi:transposase
VQGEKCPEAKPLATHPGVGPLTALGFVFIIGKAERFRCGNQIASYLGLVPWEESSGDRRRLGHISKHSVALVASGSAPSHGAQHAGMKQ